jgi:hypothetical protein
MQEPVRVMIGSIRETIAEVEAKVAELGAARAVTRVLAHLWSAHDELELLIAHRHTPATDGTGG